MMRSQGLCGFSINPSRFKDLSPTNEEKMKLACEPDLELRCEHQALQANDLQLLTDAAQHRFIALALASGWCKIRTRPSISQPGSCMHQELHLSKHSSDPYIKFVLCCCFSNQGFFFNVFVYLTETENTSNCFAPQMTVSVRVGQSRARSLEHSLGFLHGCQKPSYLSHHSLPPRVYRSREMESKCVWDSNPSPPIKNVQVQVASYLLGHRKLRKSILGWSPRMGIPRVTNGRRHGKMVMPSTSEMQIDKSRHVSS